MKRISMLVCLVLVLAIAGAAFAQSVVIAKENTVGIATKEGWDAMLAMKLSGDKEGFAAIFRQLHASGQIHDVKKGDKFIQLEGSFWSSAIKIRSVNNLNRVMWVNRMTFDIQPIK